VEHMGEMRNLHKTEDYMKDYAQMGVRMWSGFNWLKIRCSGVCCGHINELEILCKGRIIS
jgi:hypothetical protein